MLEYLICCSTTEWWLAVDMPRVLCPRTVPSEPCTGSGNHRIRTNGAEVSFSHEDPGWQVSFEGPSLDPAACRLIVDEVLQNLENATGQRGRIVEL